MQDRAIAALDDGSLGRILRFELAADATDLLTALERAVVDQPAGPVMVLDVGQMLHGPTRDAFLTSLNLRRSDWPIRVARPVVFWVASEDVGSLLRGAPDFFDWRSDTLTFPAEPVGQDLASERDTVDLSSRAGSALTAAQRRGRIEELEVRIARFGGSDDATTQRLVETWLLELAEHRALEETNRSQAKV